MVAAKERISVSERVNDRASLLLAGVLPSDKDVELSTHNPFYQQTKHKDQRIVFVLTSGDPLLQVINKVDSEDSRVLAIASLRDRVHSVVSVADALKLLVVLRLLEGFTETTHVTGMTEFYHKRERLSTKMKMTGTFVGEKGKDQATVANKTILIVAALTRIKTSDGESMFGLFTRAAFFHLSVVVAWGIDTLIQHLDQLVPRLHTLCVDRRLDTTNPSYILNKAETLVVMKQLSSDIESLSPSPPQDNKRAADPDLRFVKKNRVGTIDVTRV